MQAVYMIGHGKLAWPDFATVMEHYRIERLVDIRTIAESTIPHFNHGALARTLTGVYSHWANLGGFRRFETPGIRRALKGVLDAAAGARVCMMCSEADWRTCHRHTQLAPILIDMGWRVFQLTAGTIEEDLGIPASGMMLSGKPATECIPQIPRTTARSRFS
jgi:uncharacterized protein (DUF488 family)